MRTIPASIPTPSGTPALQDLMRLFQSQPYTSDLDNHGFQHLIHANPALALMLNLSPCITWILNVRTAKYTFVSEQAERLLGYPSQNFIKRGIEFTHHLLHPEDAGHLWKLMRHVWQYLLSLPAHRREVHQFSCDYRLRKVDGSYIRLLEKNTILQTDRKGNITHLLGVCTDISEWKKSDIMTACVISSEDDTCLICTSADEQLPVGQLLSKRQKEILQLVALGYSSKQIADKLCISFHTVNRHRQNIFDKTGRKNVGELVQYAINNGII
jgi:DNA-binding CsgD family transcriptional regulator